MAAFAARVPPFAVIHHVGRTSGKAYRTPVMAFAARPDGSAETLVVSPLPWGSDVDWCRNIRAAGSYTLTRGGHDYLVDEVRVVSSDEAVRLIGTVGRFGRSVVRAKAWVVGRLRPAPPTPTV